MSRNHEKKILIVEDDPGVATLERRRLERAGYAVVAAGDAEEALNRLKQHSVALILLDYRLPGEIDGLTFYAQVKEAGYDLPVILVTGFGNEATVIKALRVGVRDFVTKSVEYLDYLPEAVARVLRQVQTEHQLAESEARLASIINSAKDAILVASADQRITLFNAAAEQMFRCPAAAALGQPLARFIPVRCSEPPPGPRDQPEEPPGSASQLMLARNCGVRADGEEFPLEAAVSKAESADGSFYTIVVRDITERTRADQRIREQAALLDKATDAIYIRDLNDDLVFWNQGAERLYGWTAAEALGKNADELLLKCPSPELEEARQTVQEKGEWNGELHHVAKDGSAVLLASRWTLLRDDAGQPKAKLVISTDITEKRKLETQLLHAQRMEGIGFLAGGVAHDFNNLLTVITGYSEILLGSLSPEDPSAAMILEVKKAGDRAAALTRQLLAFSRKQLLAPKVLDLNVLVTEMDRMLRRLIGADIDMAASLDPALGRVKADPGQLEQVVLNLVVNARDAMPTGGRLTIETQNADLDSSYTQGHAGVRPGPYALLAVTDTGTGMDEATRLQIFQPFFTTKEVGRGTGLGLATVYGIVRQSGGHIEVYSELGHGTTFKIYLPRVHEAAVADQPSVDWFKVPQGTETVLLAEDEEGVRGLARLALASSGYTVLEARDGHEAIQVSQAHAGRIDLLITDVVMPKMSGRQLTATLTASRPGLRALYLSGYTDEAIVRHGVLETGTPFLQKPFTPTTLARKVREVLDL